MGRGITEEQKLAAAYMMGRFRQRCNLSIALIFINILLMLIMQSKSIGFNIAMLVICLVSFFGQSSSLRKLEKEFGMSEDQLNTTV